MLLHHTQNDLSGHLSFFNRMLILASRPRDFHGNVIINFIDSDYPIIIHIPWASKGFQKK